MTILPVSVWGPTRRRSNGRGVVAGIASHIVLVLLIAYIGVIVADVVAQATGTVSPLKAGPFPPLSIGWLINQPFILLSAVVVGLFTSHWSPPRSWKAVTWLSVASIAIAALAQPQSSNPMVIGLWILITPVGLLLGSFLYMRKLEQSEA